MKNKIKIERETMLRNSVYRSLVGFQDSNGHTIPCKVRKEIEDYVVSDFKTQLRMNGDNSFLKAGNNS